MRRWRFFVAMPWGRAVSGITQKRSLAMWFIVKMCYFLNF